MSKNDFTIPSNPEDVQRIKNAIIEASAQLQMAKDRQEAIKDIKTTLKEDFGMPTKLASKLITTHHKQTYDEVTKEHSDFELTYETILGDGADSTDGDDDDGDTA